MKLALKSAYRSIRALDSDNLPDFTVLTGLNGSGKTHLLEGISFQNITIDGVANGPVRSEFRLFNFTNLVPNDNNNEVAMSSWGMQRAEEWIKYRNTRAQAWNWFTNNPLLRAAVVAEVPVSLKEMNPLDEKVLRHLADIPASRHAMEQLNIQLGLIFDRSSYRHGGPVMELIPVLEQIAKGVNRPIQGLTEEDFILFKPIAPQTEMMFQQSFNQLFANYQAAREENRYRQYKNQTNPADTRVCVSDEEFLRRYGPPPWEMLNRIFAGAKLRIRVIEPPQDMYGKYHADLVDESSGAHIKFSDLSSGERIIASFALCLYYAEDRHQEVNFPKVLLFDEIDAPLHPSMTQALLSTIQSVLIEQEHLKVILTTHAPTTVALAPENSIYVITRANSTRIEKVNKDAALSVLTGDIPTLSIDYENRMQAFVESAYDAQTYGEVFQSLKAKIGSPRSLTFIAIDSARGADGGNARLRAAVRSLRKAGNKKIVGVVDFDGGSAGHEDGIFSMTDRYTIENWALDPLLIGAVLLKRHFAKAEEFGLPSDWTYMDLKRLDPSLCKTMAEKVWQRLGFNTAGGTKAQKYIGDFEIEMPTAYCSMDGHALETTILDKEPCLLAITKRRDPLFTHVIAEVARELPELIPMAFKDLFLSILN